jgi:hypothetical protein
MPLPFAALTIATLYLTCACFAQEGQIVEQQLPGAERVDAILGLSSLRLISSVRTKGVPNAKEKTIDYVKLMMFNLKKGEFKPVERPFAEMFGFDVWSPVVAGDSSCYIVATDVAGVNPFDRPDNPVPRLWLFQLSFVAAMPKVNELSFCEQKAAFETFSGRQNRPNVTTNVPATTYISPNRVLDSVQQISVALRDDVSGFCAGLSRRSAWSNSEKNLDVLWVYGFSLNPMEWQRKGSSLAGSFSQIALGVMDEGIFVAYLDGQGRPGVLRHSGNAELDLATRDQLQVDGAGEFVAVRPVNGIPSTFILLQKEKNVSKLLILRYSGKLKLWRTVQTLRINLASDISALAVGEKVYYAHQTENEGKTQVNFGQTAIPQD